jgi:phenylpropionate dioxygenase-like ring-hydroxylating dioxygenase large terminal subunit
MATRARFLNTPYSGYFGRDVPREDPELTHVGPGTPCGEYLRRFWQPVAFSEELGDLPVRVRVMGEDLVAFRDFSGRVGLLHLRCAHRGTSLEYGLVSQRGIRCCYHGWLFDVDGRILDTPGEPGDSTLKDRLCQGAYPVMEFKGLVFAYMGPPDKKPAFPAFDAIDMPGWRTEAGRKRELPCNWLQIKDNSMDQVHTAFLHTIISGSQFTDAFGQIPELEWRETPYGMIYIATRRIGEMVWVRIADLILPNVHQFAPYYETAAAETTFDGPQMTMWTVPIDDTHTMDLSLIHIDESRHMSDETIEVLKEGVNQKGGRPYEETQRQPGDYEAQVSPGPIAVHALEHLGATDRGVTMFRKLVRQEIRALKRGKDPRNVRHAPDQILHTLAQNTIRRIPPAATPEADTEMLRQIGRRVADGYYMKTRPMRETPGAGR